jgi:hypothetical protein
LHRWFVARVVINYHHHHHLHLPPWIRSFDLFRHRRVLPSFPEASTISSSSRFVVEGMFRGLVLSILSRWLIQFVINYLGPNCGIRYCDILWYCNGCRQFGVDKICVKNWTCLGAVDIEDWQTGMTKGFDAARKEGTVKRKLRSSWYGFDREWCT